MENSNSCSSYSSSLYKWELLDQSPVSKSGNQLKSYQIDGINFLGFNWSQRKNVFLADEKGLGKKYQTAVFLHCLSKYSNINGPFLIITETTKIQQWEHEIQEWTELKLIPFNGTRERINQIRDNELFEDDNTTPSFNVLLMSYETALEEAEFFENKFIWNCLILDNASKLNSFKDEQIVKIKSYKNNFLILMSNEYVSNNPREIWRFLNFLDENRFNNLQSFLDEFGDLSDPDTLMSLRSNIVPFTLRRLKMFVE